MRIFRGKFGPDTVESNALVTNLLKYPEISKVLIRQFPQYSLTYFTEGLGRYAREIEIADKKVRWAVLGRLSRPVTCTGRFSPAVTPGIGNSVFTVEFYENYANPHDIIKFKDGTLALVIDGPRPTAGGYEYDLRLLTDDPNLSLDVANLQDGARAGFFGSAFPEGSERGYGNVVYPDWYENYLTIFRKGLTVTGSALTEVTWIENNGHRVWFYTQQQLLMEQFLYELEVLRWYGRRTVDANGNVRVFDKLGRPIFTGDGLLAQIDASNRITYSGTLTERLLVEFLTSLFLNTGRRKGQWLVYTGTGGMKEFWTAMRELLKPGGVTLFFDYDAGRDIQLGFNFVSYTFMGQTMTLVHNPIFDDPNLHHEIDPASGLPLESFKMVFIDWSVQDGVSNVEIAAKSAEGVNRSFIIKYIPGMVNPFDQGSVLAATSTDGFTIEILGESGVIVRNPLSCGIIEKVA